MTGVSLAELDRHEDDRGFFVRTFAAELFAAVGLASTVAHLNVSESVTAGTLRGLHYQVPPSAEAKTIYCARGRIWDVLVDVRRDSPTFLSWEAFELGQDLVLHAPEGFAHGFLTLESGCIVQYLMSTPYEPHLERGIRWDDPVLGIEWPMQPRVISEKDATHAYLDDSWDPLR